MVISTEKHLNFDPERGAPPRVFWTTLVLSVQFFALVADAELNHTVLR